MLMICHRIDGDVMTVRFIYYIIIYLINVASPSAVFCLATGAFFLCYSLVEEKKTIPHIRVACL